MNILLINYEYPPVGGGAATATEQIARELCRLGHHPVVLTAQFQHLRGITDETGVRVIRVASRRRRREAASILTMMSFMATAGRAIRDVVHREKIGGMIAFFSVPGGPLAWWAGQGTGVPYVVSLRGGDVPGAEPGLRPIHALLTPFRRHILRRARAVIANSPGLQAMSERADPVPVKVIPNGVDCGFFRPPARSRDGAGPFRFLFVGRFQSQKNLPWLLRELAAFARETNAAFTLDLVGAGPQLAALQALAADTGLAKQLRWHGWVDRPQLLTLYQSASAVLNPSRYEGMPNVLLEAMACGLPVVASSVPGNDTVVRSGETGYLFPLDDSPAFRTALSRLVTAPDHARKLGRAGRLRVEREFSWSFVTQSYLELFPPGI